jgi:hypothetical protein
LSRPPAFPCPDALGSPTPAVPNRLGTRPPASPRRILSWRGLLSRHGLSPGARRSHDLVPAVPKVDRAAVITPQDLTVKDLLAHGSVSSGLRPCSGEATRQGVPLQLSRIASGLAPPASPRHILFQRGLSLRRGPAVPARAESWCGLLSRRGLSPNVDKSPGVGCCPDMQCSHNLAPAVLKVDCAVVITPQDLTIKDLLAHGSVSSGSRPRSGEATHQGVPL